MDNQSKEKKRIRQAPKEFLKTNRMFVLEQEAEFELIEQSDDIIELFLAMPLDERIRFYFDNFESIFTSMFPDDIGYFTFVPRTNEEWDLLERDLTKVNEPLS